MPSSAPIDVSDLGRSFGSTVALHSINWRAAAGSAIGLLGRNGAGKTTLMQTIVGLALPSKGACRTLGVPVAELDEAQLSRIGYVDQEGQLLAWISVEQHVRYVASFHRNWDLALEKRLREALELDGAARVGALSPGMRQRLALLLAVCHRPELLLLDEPMSALDPIARVEALRLIMERVIEDGTTVVVSSHVLNDVEKIIDHVLCIDQGRVVEDAPLDDLKERYSEWIVTSSGADLPSQLDEPFVLSREGDGRRVRLAVEASEADRCAFAAKHDVEVEQRSLDLAQIFPLLTAGNRS